jgi:2-dehydro-3-deoxyphosphogluconate aldolase / (4S)-4-hydroxy-2-oxoglutarate aldolase
MPDSPPDVREYLSLSPVVPVLTISDVEDAVPLAQALLNAGLAVLEVTLRTEAALEAIKRIVAEVPDAVVAAGTILTPDDLKRAADAGAKFAFSPGLADFMLKPGPIPIVPGVATPSEVMKAVAAGHRTLKFFPAVPAGGVGALKALHGPFPDVCFCPTGGIDHDNAGEFLNLPNVICVGGSWPAPAKAIEGKYWDGIETLAAKAASLAD